jgi:phosphoglycolate phosphatase
MKRLAPMASETELAHIHQAYRDYYLSGTKNSNREELFDGVLDVLNTLKGRSNIKLAVATGKHLKGVNRVVETHKLHGMFTSLQTPDTCISKPHPEMIHTAMEVAFADPSTTVMIGDTTHDMEMARNAGVHALGGNWGYHEQEELEASGAHMIIDEVGQMIDAIDQLTGVNHA